MSVQAITWALEQTVGSATGKVILLCLANYADKHGACFPGHKTIADECEVSVRTVAEWMAKLEEAGLIERSRRFRVNGSRTSDSIVLRLPWLFPTTSTEPRAEIASGEKSASPHADGSVDHMQQVHPHNRKNNLSPQPPLSGGLFATLVKEWPTEHLGNLENSEGAFEKLGMDAKRRCVEAAPLAVAAMSRRKDTRFPALVRYIRERIFEDYHDAPPIDAGGHFTVKPGMPEWSPWLGWIRSKHGERGVESIVKLGYFLTEQRWPDGHQQTKAAA
jgi:hypothetical protein